MPDIEVGKVMIRVSPDTDRFRGDTKRGVESELAGYEADVPVGADTDFSDVEPKARAAAKKARQTVEFDGDAHFEKQITGMQRRFYAAQDRRVNAFNNNVNKWKRDNEKAAKTAQDNAEKEAKIARDKLAADERARKKEEEAAKKRMDALKKESLVVADRNATDARKAAQAINKKGEESALRILKIEKEIEKRRTASVGRMAENFSSMGASMAKMGSMAKKLIPNFGTGINFGGYLVIIGAIIALAAPLIGVMSAAILAISGLIAMIVTPVAAIALGMKGIVKAAEDSGLLNVFRKDGKKNKYGAGKAVDEIGKKVNEAFEKGLTAPFKKLAAAIPNLLQSLPKVATGLSDMMSGFINALTSEEGTRLFDKTIQNIADAMSASAPGVESFTNGFLKLTTAFTNRLPGLTSWFNKTGDDFDKWVDKMSAVDPTKGWGFGDEGVTGFDKIFDGLGGFLKMLLDFVVDLGKIGLDFLQDKQKMDDFIQSLKNLGEAIEGLISLGNKMGPVWDLLAGIQGLGEYLFGKSGVKEPGGGGVGGAADNRPDIIKDISKAQLNQQEATNKHLENIENGPAFQQDAGELAKRLNPANWFTSAPIGQGGVTGMDGRPASNPKEYLDTYNEGIAELEAQLAKLREQAEGDGRSFGERFWGGVKSLIKPGFIMPPETIDEEIARIEKRLARARDQQRRLVEAGVGDEPKEVTVEVAPKSFETPLGGVGAGLAAKAADQFAESIPAPDTAEFESAVNELPVAMGTAGDGVNTAAQKIASDISAAVAGLYGVGQAAGSDFGRGMLDGLGVHEGAIRTKAGSLANTVGTTAGDTLETGSPSKWAFRLGGFFGDGLILGMGDKEEDVGAAAGQLSDKVLSGMGGPGDTRTMLENTPWTGAQSQRLKEVNKEYKELNQTLRFLNADLDASNDAGDVAIQQEIDRVKEIKKRLKVEKDALSLHREALGLDEKEKEPEIKASDYLNKAIGAGKDFAMANYTTFQSDLGISGSGAISMGVSEGINWAMGAMSNLVSSGMGGMGGNIVVNNVDDAVAAKNNQVNKQKKQYATR